MYKTKQKKHLQSVGVILNKNLVLSHLPFFNVGSIYSFVLHFERLLPTNRYLLLFFFFFKLNIYMFVIVSLGNLSFLSENIICFAQFNPSYVYEVI